MPALMETHIVELRDGRTVKVREYDDGSVRFRITGGAYWLEEAFLPGSTDKSTGEKFVNLKLVPRPAQAPPTEDD